MTVVEAGAPEPMTGWARVRPTWSVEAAFGWVRAAATAVLPDGRTVAVTAGDDRTVRVWDLAAQAPISGVRPHRGAVASVAVGGARDELTVVTTGEDGAATAWSLSALLSARSVGQAFAGENTGTADQLARTGLTTHVAT